MTGQWVFTVGMGVIAAAWWLAAFRREARLRFERHAAEARELRRQRLAEIVQRPRADEFGVVWCWRCGGYQSMPRSTAHGPGKPGEKCSCPSEAAA